MKKYLLDTNICIYFLKGQFDLQSKLEASTNELFYVSEITIAELKFGAENSIHKEKNRKNVELFQKKYEILPIFPALDLFAIEKARLRQKGKPLDDFDLLIGATAIYNNLILLTRNVSDFDRIAGIQIEDWTKT